MDLDYILTKLECIKRIEESDCRVDRFKLAQLGFLLLVEPNRYGAHGACDHRDVDERVFVHDTVYVLTSDMICFECVRILFSACSDDDGLVRVNMDQVNHFTVDVTNKAPVFSGSYYRRSKVWYNKQHQHQPQ